MTTKITEVKNEPIRKYFSEDRFDIGRLDFAMGVKADGTCDYIIDTPSQIPMSKSDADLIRKLKAMPSMGVAVDYVKRIMVMKKLTVKAQGSPIPMSKSDADLKRTKGNAFNGCSCSRLW
jgi:hypothetical protein